ncbi:MAG: DGQHR domain-containing protein [Marinoscillum sp.]|uniref:DGQHR domain-containing protein n=1 Tax=Marinoscillum sp. TaxID=2024838 RepID=UPI0032F8753C
MTFTKSNIIEARKVVQNNQEFLIGTFQIRQIRKFTRFTEHLIVGYEDVEEGDVAIEGKRQVIPIYNPEIQRKTKATKVEGIADFLINDPMAMFPTNIVIAIPNQVIESYEEKNKGVKIILSDLVETELTKPNGDVYLTVIDGQHRIRGIERAIEKIEAELNTIEKVIQDANSKEEWEKKRARFSLLKKRLLDFELLVTFFIDPTLEYQAMIFATINKTQTKVPENLVFSLFGLTKDDSPQKSSLEIVLALNGIDKSPFSNRIKLVGGNYAKGVNVPLSQATMVKSILYNISNNYREAEIDRFKKRSDLKPNPKGLIFRKYYANNEDFKIIRILYSFFSAVQDVFIDEGGKSFWNITGHEVSNILHTNVGYQALIRVLIYILPKIDEENRDKKEVYFDILKPAKVVNIGDSGVEKRYPFTSSSISILSNDIITKLGI